MTTASEAGRAKRGVPGEETNTLVQLYGGNKNTRRRDCLIVVIVHARAVTSSRLCFFSSCGLALQSICGVKLATVFKKKAVFHTAQ